MRAARLNILGAPRAVLLSLGALAAVALGGCRSTNCGSPCAPEPAPCAAPCPEPCAPPVVAPCTPCAPAPVAAPCATAPDALPPEARCGEVWCKVHTPAVTVTESHERLVKPETCTDGHVPARYQRVQDYAKVKEARLHYVTIPAQYECVTETYVICPPKSEWVCHCSRDACGNPKEKWELCATPAKLGTRTKRVLVRPETVQPVWEHAEYADVTRCVQTRPAHDPCYWCPPQFKTCTTTRCVAPESCEWRRTPECEVPAPVR